MRTRRLDSRAWLAWGLGTMTPLLLSRNPWILAVLLVAVMVVRAIWLPAATTQGMGWFLRIAAWFVTIGVVFNVLTVHSGERVIVELPASWPIAGGPITWNAVVYGILGSVALFTLLLTGITMSSHIRWIDLVLVLPRSLAPIAVTGSVAWAFLPQTAVAWTEIREAQTMRGHRFRGIRDFVPIVVPLLAGGLERSLVMAEALEARGFGAATRGTRTQRHRLRDAAGHLGIVAGMLGLAVAAYCLAVGLVWWSLLSLVAGIGSLAVAMRCSPAPDSARTRYRIVRWSPADTLVTGMAATVVGAVVAWSLLAPDSLSYRIYPEMGIPPVDLPLMVVLGLVMTPAFVYGGSECSW